MKKLLVLLISSLICGGLQAIDAPILSEEEANMPMSIPEEYLRKEGIPAEETELTETITPAPIFNKENSRQSLIDSAPSLEQKTVDKTIIDTTISNPIQRSTPTTQAACPVVKSSSSCSSCPMEKKEPKIKCTDEVCFPIEEEAPINTPSKVEDVNSVRELLPTDPIIELDEVIANK